MVAPISRAVFARPSGLLSFTDDFNRAGPGLGSNWGVDSAGATITSNIVTGTSGTSQQVVWNTALGNDHFIEVDVVTESSGGVYILLRGQGPTSLGGCFRLFYHTVSGGQLAVDKTTGGGFINNTTGVGTPGFPLRIRFEVVGSTLKTFLNGVQKASFTDTSFPTGQYVGFRLDGSLNANKVDNFSCGSM